MKEFCTYCGSKLVERKPITADHFGGLFYFSSPYDRKTGKTRMRKWVECPKRNNFWVKFFNRIYLHDAHAIGEEYLV